MLKKGLFIFIVFVCTSVFGQGDATKPIPIDSTKKIRQRLIVTPLVFFTPETSFGGGAAGVYYFYPKNINPETRPSTISALAAYTIENQVIIQIPYQFFFDQEKYWIFGELAYFLFPYRFFGIGNDVDIDNYEQYEASFIRIQNQALREVFHDFYVGLNFRLDQYYKVDFDPSGTIINEDISGFKPSTSSGFGITTLLDKRDNVFSPERGVYLNLRYTLFRNFFGSDFKFSNVILDLRKYVRLNENSSLAFQLYQQYSEGDVPFHQLALIGGPFRMRGYLEGLYRNENMSIIQAEYRRKVWNRLRMAAFVGLGEVYDSGMFYPFEEPLASYGVGLRYSLDPKEKIRIRLDFGMGNSADINGVYFTFNEAF